jgi:hypothetical protein
MLGEDGPVEFHQTAESLALRARPESGNQIATVFKLQF